METKDNRAHILATAFKLFFQKGYKSVTMSDLVRESGLSKGAFYHYFNSKEELYNHSMDMFIDHYLDNFRIEFDDQLSLKQNLITLYYQFGPISDNMNMSTQESAEALSNYLVFLQGLMRKPDYREKMAEYNQNFNIQFAEWIKKAQDRGEILSTLDATLLAKHFTSLMKGIGVLHAFVDQSEPVATTFTNIISQFFDLIEIKNEAS
jgi:AcrR family transcriptional regulator